MYKNQQTFPCPCCDRLTFGEETGISAEPTFQTCGGCGWHDDKIIRTDADLDQVSGMNPKSLRESREDSVLEQLL